MPKGDRGGKRSGGLSFTGGVPKAISKRIEQSFILDSDANPVDGYPRGELKYFVDVNGGKHNAGDIVEGNSWKLTFNSHNNYEKEDGKWLEKLIHEKVFLNPKAEKPDGVKSCDYVTESGIRIEQKGPNKQRDNGKNKIENWIGQGKGQAHIFLVNITGLGYSVEEVKRQVNNTFYRNRTKEYAEEIIVKDGDRLVGWYKK